MADGGSTVRSTIERERLLGNLDDSLKDHPSIKLIKKTLDSNYQLPIGYNGITAGLEVPNGIDLTIPTGSKLVSL
jgi:hypothetical protein